LTKPSITVGRFFLKNPNTDILRHWLETSMPVTCRWSVDKFKAKSTETPPPRNAVGTRGLPRDLRHTEHQALGVNTPPPNGGGFGLRLEAGLIDPSGRFSQTTLKLSSGSSGF
jgi:hypothetical protein